MPANLSPSPSRYLLIDVVRWISFCTIVVYHLTYALWSPGGWAEIPIRGPFVWPLEVFARTFAFSGFTVFILSFFLFGYRASPYRPLRLILWMLPFAAIWALLVEDAFFSWDIYPFLLLTLAGLAGGLRLRVPLSIWISGSAVAMSIPFWLAESWLPFSPQVTAALVGACETRRDFGDWPLLPWFFVATFAFSLGRWAYTQKSRLATMRWRELAAWTVPLAVSAPFLGAYYATPLGDHFACYVFRRGPISFWAHLVWLLFVVRMSLIAEINERLSRLAVVRRISRSPVNRAFFLVYFAHYPLVATLGLWARRWDLDFQPWILALTFAMIILIVECSSGVPWRKANVNLSTT